MRRILVCLVLAGVLSAQETVLHSDVSRALDGMNALTWVLRAKAFRAMPDLVKVATPSAEEADRLKVGLIRLLSTENAAVNAPDTSNQDGAEEYEEYYASLISAVATLGDKRAVPALLGASPTGGLATRGVARFGDKALGPVVEQVESRDSQLVSGAVDVLREMLKMHTLTDPESHLRVKNALRAALARPEFDVRLSAIDAIEYLDDRDEFVPILQDLAEHDPFKLAEPSDKGSTVEVFVVRGDAARLLGKIANHETPSHKR